MRLLLDHCLDWRLSRSLPGHEVKAAGKIGWGSFKDGALLSAAQSEFDVLVTSDKQLPHQQNLQRFQVGCSSIVLFQSFDLTAFKVLLPKTVQDSRLSE